MTVPAPAARHFKLDDANRTLPLVRKIVQDIVQLFPDLQRRRERLGDLQETPRGSVAARNDAHADEVRQMELEIEADEDRLRGYLQELEGIGADLKDPFTGLIDFPALVAGREVCLCWKLGEGEIGFWHETDAGFSGRRPIETLPAGKTELS